MDGKLLEQSVELCEAREKNSTASLLSKFVTYDYELVEDVEQPLTDALLRRRGLRKRVE